MKYPIFKIHLESWIILAVLTLVESERPEFREDFRFEKGFDAFYKVHQTALPWQEARARCEGEGAHLMVPENLDEVDAMPLLISSILNSYRGVFIGIHDLYSERSFVTIGGSSMMGSILNLLWEHKQPTFKAGRCLVMHHNGRLSVHSCEEPLPFICKVKASTINYYHECDTYDPRWVLGPNGTCYLLHTEPQTWYDSFGTCLAAGGHLAIMNSRSEAEYVRSMFKELPERRLPDNDFAFLGFNDLFLRFHYRTIQGETLEETGYADWTLVCGQKENSSCINRCGGLRRSGLLALFDCDTPAMFICEKVRSGAHARSNEAVPNDPSTNAKTVKRGKVYRGVTRAGHKARNASAKNKKHTKSPKKTNSTKSLTTIETKSTEEKQTNSIINFATTNTALRSKNLATKKNELDHFIPNVHDATAAAFHKEQFHESVALLSKPMPFLLEAPSSMSPLALLARA